MHVQHCDVMYDITALSNDVTSTNKMMYFRHGMSKAHLLNMVYVTMVHPEHRVFHTMPQPPPHIWAHPHNRSLHPLYLSTFYTNGMSFITKIRINQE